MHTEEEDAKSKIWRKVPRVVSISKNGIQVLIWFCQFINSILASFNYGAEWNSWASPMEFYFRLSHRWLIAAQRNPSFENAKPLSVEHLKGPSLGYQTFEGVPAREHRFKWSPKVIRRGEPANVRLEEENKRRGKMGKWTPWGGN